MEKRFISSSIELRAAADSNKLVGYAATYNQRSLDLGGFTEVLAPGCFDRSLTENGDVAAYYEHNPSNGILGRTPTTLKLRSDANGLAFELDIPDTTMGRDLKEMVRRGDIRNMSFGFVCNADNWENKDNQVTRTVTDADIHEISFVSFPAYPSSSAALRSMCFPDGAPTVPIETKTEATAEVKEEVRTTSQEEQDYQDWQIAIRRMFRHKS
jgi:HK97 family phage prohead protease